MSSVSLGKLGCFDAAFKPSARGRANHLCGRSSQSVLMSPGMLNLTGPTWCCPQELVPSLGHKFCRRFMGEPGHTTDTCEKDSVFRPPEQFAYACVCPTGISSTPRLGVELVAPGSQSAAPRPLLACAPVALPRCFPRLSQSQSTTSTQELRRKVGAVLMWVNTALTGLDSQRMKPFPNKNQRSIYQDRPCH